MSTPQKGCGTSSLNNLPSSTRSNVPTIVEVHIVEGHNHW